MLAASLVDLGSPFLSGSVPAAELLPRITSVSENRADRFYRRVMIVEVDREAFRRADGAGLGGLSPSAFAAHAPAVIEKGDPRRLGLAASIPSGGGNKAGPLGWYPAPVYPVYESTLARFLRRGKHAEDPEEGAREAVRGFVHARASRTSGSYLSGAQLDAAADAAYHRLASQIGEDEEYEGAALLAFLEVGGGTPFYYSALHAPVYTTAAVAGRGSGSGEGGSAVVAGSRLRPGYVIRADLDKVLEGAWEAKITEGEQRGVLEDGECSVCGRLGHVTAAYSPSWPFVAQAWAAPLPMNGANRPRGLGSHNLALSTALCGGCYRAFVIGVSLFKRFSRVLPVRVRREIFAPAHSGAGRKSALLRPNDSLPPVRMAAFATPLLPQRQAGVHMENSGAQRYARALADMAEGEGRTLERVIGAETALPEELANDEYRISAIYYGSPAQREGVVDLYAAIEDVVPSRMLALEAVVRDLARDPGLLELAGALGVRGLEDHGLVSLPYLLSRAYGSPGLWRRLSEALAGEALPARPFRERAWRCMRDLTRNVRDNAYAIREEVYFYLVYEEFLAAYRRHVMAGARDAPKGGGVKPAAEMLVTLREEPPERWPLEDGWSLGFAIGHVLRDFARQYYAVTGRDFLRYRILGFAGVPTPEGVVGRGLGKLDEYAFRARMNVRRDLYEKAGYCLDAYGRMTPTNKEEKESFMLGFKSGYWVSAPRPPQPENGTAAEPGEGSSNEGSEPAATTAHTASDDTGKQER